MYTEGQKGRDILHTFSAAEYRTGILDVNKTQPSIPKWSVPLEINYYWY
jgi:hypothetical protein